MFVGEQPGDKEDLEGKPFVGPAGALLDKALVEAGIDRKQTYVTNAVKHFKWEPRGKRRIHKKPNSAEIAACRAWLDAEIRGRQAGRGRLPGSHGCAIAIGPRISGDPAARTVLDFRAGMKIAATVHPSSILRAPDDEARHREMQLFISDLQVIAKFVQAENGA